MPDPVGEEFRLISEGSRLGMTLNDCLERSTERTPTAELRFFAIVLAIQQQTGGNLAETLAKLSEVLRGRKRMRDKVQAMSSEAKSSAGIIGSLPIIVGTLLSLVAPKYVGVLFTTDTGHFLIAGGVAWMGMGILVMRQMIHFDM
jgi:tight adherence protein B